MAKATMTGRKCYHCKKPLANEWYQFIEPVYLIADIEGYPDVSCKKCYREKVNPILTEDDLDNEIENITQNFTGN